MESMGTVSQKILIVEDEASMLNVLGDTFATLGLQVFKAKDGTEGLASALKEHPDIILLDILMPKMDGMEMMKKLRADGWGKDVRIIILTNVNPDSDTTIKAIVENQPSYYLIKSDVKLEDIVEKVKEVLNIH